MHRAECQALSVVNVNTITKPFSQFACAFDLINSPYLLPVCFQAYMWSIVSKDDLSHTKHARDKPFLQPPQEAEKRAKIPHSANLTHSCCFAINPQKIQVNCLEFNSANLH